MNLGLPREKTSIVGKPGVVTVVNKVENASSVISVRQNKFEIGSLLVSIREL